MRNIDLHHDGHGLNDDLVILADNRDPKAGNSSHRYSVAFKSEDENKVAPLVATIQFQHGPRNVVGSTPGCTTAAIIAILIDHLEGFQTTELRDRDTAIAITELENALLRIKKRADDRAKRKVLGTYNK